MRIYDRYNGNTIAMTSLPDIIEIGRFVVIDKNSHELTYHHIGKDTGKDILQGILSDKMQAMQELLCTFQKKSKESQRDVFSVYPIVQGIDKSIILTDFERFLDKNVFHIKEIFRSPYSMLRRVMTKMNASRAKRLPARSYSYLSSHTEDWLEKTITTFKPLRVISEELDQNFDVYENRLAVAVVERCISHIEKRLQELKDTEAFIEGYEKSLDQISSEQSWHEKALRTFTLAGKVYKDMDVNYKGEDKTSDKKRSTVLISSQKLNDLRNELIKLRGSELYDAVNKKNIIKINWRPTNVTVNHKHYKYLRPLWNGLSECEKKKSKDMICEEEDLTIAGMHYYAMSLIAYCTKIITHSSYSIKGSYSHFKATHPLYSDIEAMIDDYGTIHLNIGRRNIRIVVIGCKCVANEEELKNDGVFVFSVTPYTGRTNSRVLEIYPYDLDSIERIGSFLRKFLLMDYIDNLNMHFSLPGDMWIFKECLGASFLRFYEDSKTVSYKSYPWQIDENMVLRKLEMNKLFKNIDSHIRRKEIRDAMSRTVHDLNRRTAAAIEKQFFCFQCGQRINNSAFTETSFITCTTCGFTLDSHDMNHIILANKNEKYRSLSPSDWGLDHIVITNWE